MIRHYFLAIFFLLVGFISSAQYNVQSKYFVYLQTEPAQPFYIRINGQQLSANASGYLILPQLKDDDYKLVVGFPQNKYPEQTYNFTIDSKDKGYLVKDFGGSEGWGLFDLQTMAVQKPLSANEAKAMANTTPSTPEPQTVPKENVSDFTKVLSKAANDPGLLEKPKEEPKPVIVEKKEEVVIEETPKPVEEQTETVSSAPQETAKPKPAETIENTDVSSAPVEQPASQPKNTVSSSNGQSGVSVTYPNKNEQGQSEPVTIFIPEPRVAQKEELPVEEEIVQEAIAEEKTQETPVPPTVEQKKSSEKFEVEEKLPIEEKSSKEVEKVVTTNSDCKKVADEDDFLRLRRQMAQKDNDEAMISQAKTAFRSKCYSTAQIKYLSSMFLSNAGKYNFFEVARQHVADRENFASLGSEIQDQSYREKFNTLVGQ